MRAPSCTGGSDREWVNSEQTFGSCCCQTTINYSVAVDSDINVMAFSPGPGSDPKVWESSAVLRGETLHIKKITIGSGQGDWERVCQR